MQVIEDPETVLNEHRARQGGGSSLDEEINRIESAIKALDAQKQRAVRLFTIAEADDADVKRELARISRLHLQARSRLAELEGRRAVSTQFEPMAERVTQYCALMRDRLSDLSFEQKREVLEALQEEFTLDKEGQLRIFWYFRLLKTRAFILPCDVHRHVCSKIKVLGSLQGFWRARPDGYSLR